LASAQQEEKLKQRARIPSQRRTSDSQEKVSAGFSSTIMAPSLKSKMKTLITNIEKEKKGRTHSMTQKINVSSHLENVATQYLNGGTSSKQETSMSPHKESIQNISHQVIGTSSKSMGRDSTRSGNRTNIRSIRSL